MWVSLYTNQANRRYCMWVSKPCFFSTMPGYRSLVSRSASLKTLITIISTFCHLQPPHRQPTPHLTHRRFPQRTRLPCLPNWMSMDVPHPGPTAADPSSSASRSPVSGSLVGRVPVNDIAAAVGRDRLRMVTPVQTTSSSLPGPAVCAPLRRPSGCLERSVSRGSRSSASKNLWAVVLSTGVLAHQAWMAPCTATCTVTSDSGPSRAEMIRPPALFTVTIPDVFGTGSESTGSALHIAPSLSRKFSNSCPALPEGRPPSARRWDQPDPRKFSPDPPAAHGVPRVPPTKNLPSPSPLPRSSGSAYLRVTFPHLAQFASSWVSGAGWDAAPRSCAAFRFGWEPRLWISPHCSQSGAPGRGRGVAGRNPLVGIGGFCSQGSSSLPATASTSPASAGLSPQKPSGHPPAQVTSPGHSNPAVRSPHCRLRGCSGQNVSRSSCQPANEGLWAIDYVTGALTYQTRMIPCMTPSSGSPESDPGRGESICFPASFTASDSDIPGTGPEITDSIIFITPSSSSLPPATKFPILPTTILAPSLLPPSTSDSACLGATHPHQAQSASLWLLSIKWTAQPSPCLRTGLWHTPLGSKRDSTDQKEENRSSPVSRGSGSRWLSSSAGSLSLKQALATERRAGSRTYDVVLNEFIPASPPAHLQDLHDCRVYGCTLNRSPKRKIPPCLPTHFGEPSSIPHSSSFWYYSPTHTSRLPPPQGRPWSPQPLPNSVNLASVRRGGPCSRQCSGPGFGSGPIRAGPRPPHQLITCYRHQRGPQ